jgi:hypothetical protein
MLIRLAAIVVLVSAALALGQSPAVAQSACPSGASVSVAPPDAVAPTTVNVALSGSNGTLPISTGDSTHLHYFIDVPAAAAGTAIPISDPRIIHSGALRQDLGWLSAGAHTVTVVLGQADHVACEARDSATFIVGQAQAAPIAPKSGNAGLAGSGGTALTVVLLIGAAVAVVIAARLWTTRGGGGR